MHNFNCPKIEVTLTAQFDKSVEIIHYFGTDGTPSIIIDFKSQCHKSTIHTSISVANTTELGWGIGCRGLNQSLSISNFNGLTRNWAT